MTQTGPANNASTDASAWSDDARWALGVADAAILLLDPAGQVAHANAAATALAMRLQTGGAMTPAVADEASLLRLVPEGAWDEACAHGRWSAQLQVEQPPLVIEAKLFCEPGAAGRRIAVFGDVTARSSREIELEQRHDELQRTYEKLAGAQEQLLQSEKMASIGQLAAGVAHEINNPIGYVHSNLGTLQEYVAALFALVDAYAAALQDSDPAASRDALAATRQRLDIDFITGDLPQLLKESREGIERVTKIVRDLKDFSRADRDSPMRPADLQEGLETTLNIVWNDLKYKVRIERHYSPMPLVECHRSEINQVLMNLLINAGQAIEGRGTIVLATGADEGEAWISVTDSGVGIPDEVMQRIFDPFYTTKPIGHGTGLGLAICYSLVAKHHGRIEVSSRPGVGSTFRVVLPIVQPREGDDAAAMEAAPQ